MPRQPRLVVLGYPNHVILRGNNRNAIFYDDKDKRFFINCLKESKEKTKSKIYAYCLMPNHVHLFVEPSTIDGLGNMMQSLGRRYVQYINKIYDRTGTLWEGRFKSCLIDTDEYFLTCNIYIESNPVRAGIVKNPVDYPWSSCRCKVTGKQDILVDKDIIYMSLGESDYDRQFNYNDLFVKNIYDEEIKNIRETTQKCGVLGNKDFINKVSKMLNKEIILRQRGRPKKSL